MLRSLRARLIASYVILSLAVLVAVGGSMFLILRGLHADATTGSLGDVAGSVLPQVRASIASGNLRGTILDVRDELAARGIVVMVIGADGRLRPIDGIPSGDVIMPTDGNPGDTLRGSVTLDGRPYLYAATVLRRASAIAPRAVAFLSEDRSGALALADLGRTVPVVALVILLVGGALAWLLARSVTRPLERLAAAAAAVPGGEPASLPLDGPAEVRALTGTFNAMSGEVAETRRREAELLANLRHDLRTPLTVISGFAAALADGTATGDDAERAARAIVEEAERLERLVGELGAIERLRSGDAGLRPEELDAAEVLATARERFLARAEAAGVSLDVSGIGGAGLTFAADRQAVERILANLVSNALAVVPRGGHIWLSAAPVAPASVALTVTDDGPGFPPGAAVRAFERFYRADPMRSGPGSGLGLAIVRELALAHGGSAVAENIAPHGARLGVVLPLVPRVPSVGSLIDAR
jgi:signal transduction histidine kinase